MSIVYVKNKRNGVTYVYESTGYWDKENKMIADGFRDFPGYDRRKYPDKIRRVTAGSGGEAFLILGTDKTVLMDCGMAYCAEDMIGNIKEILTAENRKLDMIFLSHTHYDHIGGLPYVLKIWPEAIVYGADYCKRVLPAMEPSPKWQNWLKLPGNNIKIRKMKKY